MTKNPILILGATSPVARAAAQIWAERGHTLYLACRDIQELERISSDLIIRYDASIFYSIFDAEDEPSHKMFLEKVQSKVGSLFGVLYAAGYLGNQRKAAAEFSEAKKIININYSGAVPILSLIANGLEAQGSGFIAAISSVAADRGRQSNYIYGSAKAGLNTFLQGLRNRLFPRGIAVTTIKPGFIDTSMTYGLPNMFLVASPVSIGRGIVKAIDKKKNVVYLPWFWQIIMSIICTIPESLFKRLKL